MKAKRGLEYFCVRRNDGDSAARADRDAEKTPGLSYLSCFMTAASGGAGSRGGFEVSDLAGREPPAGDPQPIGHAVDRHGGAGPSIDREGSLADHEIDQLAAQDRRLRAGRGTRMARPACARRKKRRDRRQQSQRPGPFQQQTS